MKPKVTGILCVAAMMGAPLPIPSGVFAPIAVDPSPPRRLSDADVERIEAAKAKRARRAAKRKGTT